MTVPMITHRDLVAFAADRVNLKRSEVDDQRAQVARLRNRIENKIAVSPGYGFVKALHCGSVAKGTALRSGSDRDLAVGRPEHVVRHAPRAAIPDAARRTTGAHVLPKRCNFGSIGSSFGHAIIKVLSGQPTVCLECNFNLLLRPHM